MNYSVLSQNWKRLQQPSAKGEMKLNQSCVKVSDMLEYEYCPALQYIPSRCHIICGVLIEYWWLTVFVIEVIG